MIRTNSGVVKIHILVDPYTERYDKERAEGGSGEYKTIAYGVPFDIAQYGHIFYQDTGVEKGKSYCYRVKKTGYGFVMLSRNSIKI